MGTGAVASKARGTPSANRRSDAIKIARVICILGIVYVHGWTGLTIAQMGEQPPSVYSLTYWFLVEVLGRSAVPLLSVISGWLVVSTVGKRRYRSYIQNKVENLLAPMAAWNLIVMFAIGMAVVTIGWRTDTVPAGMLLVNEIIFLTGEGTLNYQTVFLRDIFVCMAAAPLLVRLPTRLLWAMIGGALIWSIAQWELYVLLRPQILAFFVLGIIARRGQVGEALRHVPALLLAVAFAILAASKMWVSMQGDSFQLAHPHWIAVLDNLLRVAAAAGYWRLALWLAGGPFSRALCGAERYAFMIFCSHVLIAKMVGPIQGKVVGGFGNPLWLASFIVQPLIALAGAWAISQFLLRFSPPFARLLSGGRLTRSSSQTRGARA